MQGKVAMVTGGTAGIGRVTTRRLAEMGATVVAVARNAQRGEKVIRDLRRETRNEEIFFVRADLSSVADVRRVARDFAESHPRLDVLVNNAGAIFHKRRESVDGIEMTFALNHLGPFLLTNLLLDRVRAADRGRIVVVSSRAHLGTRLDFDDLEMREHYHGIKAYQRSKLANLLFTRALARRLEGEETTVNALHPGFVKSEFGRGNGPVFGLLVQVAMLVGRAIDVEKGAETSVHLAASPSVEGVSGRYFVKCEEQEPSKAARDDAAAERLWQASERMIEGVPAPG